MNGRIFLLKGVSEGSSEKDDYEKEFDLIGYQTVVVPTLDFKFVNSDRLFHCLKEEENYSGLVLTSQRAVEAIASLRSKFNEAHGVLSIWQRKPVFVVGPATEKAASEKLGFQTEGSHCGDAETLAMFIQQRSASLKKPVLFPCSSIKRDVLQKRLEKFGISLDCQTSYESIPNPDICQVLKDACKSGFPEIVVFFSPSGVKSALPAVIKIMGLLKDNNIKLAAIGSVTQSAINSMCEDVGFDSKCWCCAEEPTPKSLVEAIVMKKNEKLSA